MQAVRDCILLQITDIWTSSVQRKVEIKLVYDIIQRVSYTFIFLHSSVWYQLTLNTDAKYSFITTTWTRRSELT